MEEKENHLTIEEIKRGERIIDIYQKVGVGSAIVSGLFILLGCISAGLLEKQNISVLRILGFIFSISFVTLGAYISDFSLEAFDEKEKLNELLDNEKKL